MMSYSGCSFIYFFAKSLIMLLNSSSFLKCSAHFISQAIDFAGSAFPQMILNLLLDACFLHKPFDILIYLLCSYHLLFRLSFKFFLSIRCLCVETLASTPLTPIVVLYEPFRFLHSLEWQLHISS